LTWPNHLSHAQGQCARTRRSNNQKALNYLLSGSKVRGLAYPHGRGRRWSSRRLSWDCRSAASCRRCAIVKSHSDSRWSSRQRSSFASIAKISRSCPMQIRRARAGKRSKIADHETVGKSWVALGKLTCRCVPLAIYAPSKKPPCGGSLSCSEVLGPHISQGPGRRWERRGQNNKIIIRKLGVQASIAPAHIACRVVIRSNPPLRNYACPTGGMLLLVRAVVNPEAILKSNAGRQWRYGWGLRCRTCGPPKKCPLRKRHSFEANVLPIGNGLV
jgi:hypothetical protein